MRIFILIYDKTGLALSEISSWIIIAEVILSSRNLLETRALKEPSRELAPPPERECHSLTVRIVLSVEATDRSSPVVRQPPACALRKCPEQFPAPPNDGAPNLPLNATASSVCCRSCSTFFSSNTGSRFNAISRASSIEVIPASLSRILSSSSVL